MINPFSKPANPQEWRDRARALQTQLQGLTIDELMIGGAAKHGDASVRDARRYNPNQPRVPAGHSDGGQWISKGGVGSDVTPDNDWRLGAQYANRARTSGSGPLSQATPAQLFRLSAARAQARDAIRRVQELDPNWRPQPSAYQTVEGMIRAHQADAHKAEARIAELNRSYLVGPGPFATESIPVPPHGQRLTVDGQRQLNAIGSVSGCHTCGRFEPRH